MGHLSIAVHTLGCKLNQLESESVLAAFKEAGWDIKNWGQEADIYILNTCTVTSMAEQKARRLIRKTLKERAHAAVLVTGCYAQLDSKAIAAIGLEGFANRLVVLSGDAKSALHRLPAFLEENLCTSIDLPALLAQWAKSPTEDERFSFAPSMFEYHSRGFLKIQDGCDNVCSFCRVRLARGPSQSLGRQQVLERLLALEAAGYNEAVLTGINLHSWREGPSRLPELLAFLLENTDHIALRISSSEIDGFNEAYAKVLSSPRIRPHFHLSVQSGSDNVLKRMRRRYTRSAVYQAVELLHSVKERPFIACDIITGFPGESEDDFNQTLSLCTELNFGWIHAFPFSPRPGTEAASLNMPVPEWIAAQRVAQLTTLAREGKARFAQSALGSCFAAIVEEAPRSPLPQSSVASGEPPHKNSRYVYALSEHYLRCKVEVPQNLPLPKQRSAIYCQAQSLTAKQGSGLHSDLDLLARLVNNELSDICR